MRFQGLIPPSVLLLATLSLPASGQDYSYRYAFVSRVEGEVSLQRASEPEPEEGASNVPILPGDRLWTLGGSRAEVRFADGSALRLSEGAKVDFVDLDSETILRVWSGSVILELLEPRDSLRIDSPAGTIRPTREGRYRIDVENGDAVALFVPRGSAELANSRGSVLVQSGETSYAAANEPPQIPAEFNTASLDDFARWSESLDREAPGTREVIVRSLPHEVRNYADDLGRHGDWDYDSNHGYVWYPQVSVGWAPYTHGRWWNSRFGYTWISSEPWGWAPYHYGRWGFNPRGWYWIPGSTWGPAWVSFALGSSWVGWSPLGFHNRPVYLFNNFYGNRFRRWRAGWNDHHGGWNFCDRDDFRSGVVTRNGYRRLDPDTIRRNVGGVRVVNEASALDRELNPRAIRGAEPRRAFSRSENRRAVSSGGFARPSERERPERGEATRRTRETPRAAPSTPSRVIDRSAVSRTRVNRGEQVIREDRMDDTARRARESERARSGIDTRAARPRVESPRSRSGVAERPGGVRGRAPISRSSPPERTARPSRRERDPNPGASIGSERPGRAREQKPSSMGSERSGRGERGGAREMSRGGRSSGEGRSFTGGSSVRGDRGDRGNRGAGAGAGASRSKSRGGARPRSNRTPR